MPECPNCKKYYFGNPDQCPECMYDFKLRRVVTREEKAQLNSQAQRVAEKKIMAQNAREEAMRASERMEKFKATQDREEAIRTSALYEYTTAYIADGFGGGLNQQKLEEVLAAHAQAGWRLHTVFTNELGKNSTSVGGFGTNSTHEITILIFERCIRKGE